ncbi:protein yippee-like At5g53940 isoform X4 [Selaginella moellendorffii]|uniref:protein yippee-like At5g53940 isoform X4 n=1 Tax=Selaginella moellendorffii TaxID=88036 RepID=UPI000D1C9B7E|nr:protein yippee-like At5g53940 isoform X4 [Selaginella moellendorffii]|eukprot:XP_024532982.1 protein yippee-like At5g53940 isoform X4 [Selaginella moellendorffii]
MDGGREVLFGINIYRVLRAREAQSSDNILELSVNVFEGPLEERMMTTGVHTVADIYCKGCQQNVGWKYEFAQHKAQKYKEGKFILERGRVVGCEKGDFYLDTQAIGSDPDDVPLE